MNAPPVAHRELLVAARRRSTLWIRLGAALVATVIIGVGLLAHALSGGAVGGGGVFVFLVVLTAIVVSAAGLLLTADAISAEARDGTLGLLFLTDLSGFDVITGKLAAAGIKAAGALVAVLPILAVTVMLGGVTAGDFWRNALALINLLWVALNLGLAMSARTSDAQRALTAALIWGVFLFIALPGSARMFGLAFAWPQISSLLGASPIWTLICARDVQFTLSPEAYWRSLIISHGVGWLFLLSASRTVTKVWREGGQAWSRKSVRARSEKRPPATLENPVAALTMPSVRERGFAWGIVALAVISTGVFWEIPRSSFFSQVWTLQPFAPAFWALQGMFAWKCCVFFHQLRSGAGELLLTAPVKELQVLGGAWTGARRLVQGPLVTLAVLHVVITMARVFIEGTEYSHRVFASVVSLVVVAYQVSCLVTDLVASGWLTARFGLRSRSAVQALGMCFVVLFLPRLVLLCVPNLLISAVALTWARSSLVHNIREWITGDREMRGSRPGKPVR
ncbi:MAG TPA: hypothetical protein PLX89_15660 [Verrucomicrobiota bacterium]|nr:hypothetical protein [Verrucomicrobiota bacterium]